jgi:beta-lactamase superfamily II metal-dependent hydrolase
MHKVPRFLCFLISLFFLWSVAAPVFADLPFVRPGQDIVVPLSCDDLQFWERQPGDPRLIAPPPLAQDVPILTVIAVDVGAKDCIVLQCDGEAVLLDCGDTGPHDLVARVIRQMGIDHFKAAINTHPHDDHLRAFPNILSQFPADAMYVCFPEDSDIWTRFLSREMEALHIPVVQLDIEQPMMLGPATLRFRQYNKGNDINQRSLIIQAALGERTMLLTADATGGSFDRLIETMGPEAFQGDILKAPHHGCELLPGSLIRAVNMQAVFATGYPWVGGGEDFRDQLDRIHFKAVYTVLGSVVMKTDGKIWTISQLPRELP